MNISEETFASWAQGPSTTESGRCENAETAVRKAVAADATLSKLGITVFAQGSYKARTNVKQDSDVDICVRYDGAFFEDYPEGKGRKDFGNGEGSLSFSDFKDMVEKALKSYFGVSSVARGSKAFDIHANTHRVDADVVPTFEHRWYTGRLAPGGSHHYISGVAFLTGTNPAQRIVNWPQQTYDNGVSRNDNTGRRYKRVIRILKRLRNKMQEDGVSGASNIASFLIECLVWNTPIEAFQPAAYAANVRFVIADIWNRTRKDEDCLEWREVSELKYLFRSSQPWTRQQANQFLHAAWNYVGFET